MITSWNDSSLVLDSLRDLAGRQNVPLVCLYLDLTAHRAGHHNSGGEVLDKYENRAQREISRRRIRYRIGSGEKTMQKEVPSPRVELGTNRLTEYYSRV